jgi:hypothetical protein
MGEDERNPEQLRKHLLAEIEQWMFPATEWEARAVDEVRRLPVHTVSRVTAAQAAAIGMPPEECHANCRRYEKNDPEGKSRQVTGWAEEDGGYVLHSVVERDGVLFDITPSLMDPRPTIRFIRDAKIEWR